MDAPSLGDTSEPTREPSPPNPPIPVTEVARELLAGPGADAVPSTVHLGEPGTAPPSLPFVVTDSATPPTALANTKVQWRKGIPRKLGPYELLEELGHGGMGVVYRARHERLGTLFAVKVLIAGEHASPEAIARFQREAASVAKMGKHANIVTVFDLGEEGGLAFYAMELVQGKSLRTVLAGRVFEPKEAAALVEKVARALHFAHGHGIIHRDMKPDNVVVRDDQEPQVMDFGLARDVSAEAGLSVTGQAFGSPNYMAPEQLRGAHAECDARTDVYGVGGVLYEMLTRLPPHPGKALADIAKQILLGEVVAPRRLAPDVPRDLETICLKCLDVERDRRYATAEALAEDLGRFLRGDPVVARPVGLVVRAVRRIVKNRAVTILGLGLILIGIVSIAFQRRAEQREDQAHQETRETQRRQDLASRTAAQVEEFAAMKMLMLAVARNVDSLPRSGTSGGLQWWWDASNRSLRVRTGSGSEKELAQFEEIVLCVQAPGYAVPFKFRGYRSLQPTDDYEALSYADSSLAPDLSREPRDPRPDLGTPDPKADSDRNRIPPRSARGPSPELPAFSKLVSLGLIAVGLLVVGWSLRRARRWRAHERG